MHINALVAQWIEHLASDQGVVGSSPAERIARNKAIVCLVSGLEGFFYVE